MLEELIQYLNDFHLYYGQFQKQLEKAKLVERKKKTKWGFSSLFGIEQAPAVSEEDDKLITQELEKAFPLPNADELNELLSYGSKLRDVYREFEVNKNTADKLIGPQAIEMAAGFSAKLNEVYAQSHSILTRYQRQQIDKEYRLMQALDEDYSRMDGMLRECKFTLDKTAQIEQGASDMVVRARQLDDELKGCNELIYHNADDINIHTHQLLPYTVEAEKQNDEWVKEVLRILSDKKDAVFNQISEHKKLLDVVLKQQTLIVKKHKIAVKYHEKMLRRFASFRLTHQEFAHYHKGAAVSNDAAILNLAKSMKKMHEKNKQKIMRTFAKMRQPDFNEEAVSAVEKSVNERFDKVGSQIKQSVARILKTKEQIKKIHQRSMRSFNQRKLICDQSLKGLDKQVDPKDLGVMRASVANLDKVEAEYKKLHSDMLHKKKEIKNKAEASVAEMLKIVERLIPRKMLAEKHSQGMAGTAELLEHWHHYLESIQHDMQPLIANSTQALKDIRIVLLNIQTMIYIAKNVGGFVITDTAVEVTPDRDEMKSIFSLIDERLIQVSQRLSSVKKKLTHIDEVGGAFKRVDELRALWNKLKAIDQEMSTLVANVAPSIIDQKTFEHDFNELRAVSSHMQDMPLVVSANPSHGSLVDIYNQLMAARKKIADWFLAHAEPAPNVSDEIKQFLTTRLAGAANGAKKLQASMELEFNSQCTSIHDQCDRYLESERKLSSTENNTYLLPGLMANLSGAITRIIDIYHLIDGIANGGAISEAEAKKQALESVSKDYGKYVDNQKICKAMLDALVNVETVIQPLLDDFALLGNAANQSKQLQETLGQLKIKLESLLTQQKNAQSTFQKDYDGYVERLDFDIKKCNDLESSMLSQQQELTKLFNEIKTQKRRRAALHAEFIAMREASANGTRYDGVNGELYKRLSRQFLYANAKKIITDLAEHAHGHASKKDDINAFIDSLYDPRIDNLQALLDAIDDALVNPLLVVNTNCFSSAFKVPSTTAKILQKLRNELSFMINQEVSGHEIARGIDQDIKHNEEIHCNGETFFTPDAEPEVNYEARCDELVRRFVSRTSKARGELSEHLVSIANWSGHTTSKYVRMCVAIAIHQKNQDVSNGLYTDQPFLWAYQHLKYRLNRVKTFRSTHKLWSMLDAVDVMDASEEEKFTSLKQIVGDFYFNLRKSVNGSEGWLFGKGSRLGDEIEHFLTDVADGLGINPVYVPHKFGWFDHAPSELQLTH